jgi:sulfoxide reductase heme-binding subunit YedZ
LNTLSQIRFIWKPLIFAACLVPVVFVVTDALDITGSLGANPIEEILDRFGNWGLRLLMFTLAITPLRRITGLNWLLRFRRMLGLFTFFYILLHFTTWFWLDQGMLMSAIIEDVAKRPFITIGFAAFILLTAMAATSTNSIRRRMGRRWDKLHYSIYVVGVLAVWHYWWQVKKDVTEPLVYAGILLLLLGYRIWRSRSYDRSRK